MKSIISLVVAVMIATPAAFGALIVGHTADHSVRESTLAKIRENDETLEVRRNSSSYQRYVAFFIFDLTGAPTPQNVGDATLTMHLTEFNTSLSGMDLYGVGFSDDPEDDLTTERHYYATGIDPDPNVTLIAQNVWAQGDGVGEFSASNQALVDYLLTRPAGEAGNYVFFRLNLHDVDVGFNQSHFIASADHSDPNLRPTLEVIPEPSTLALLGLAGLLLMKRRRV